jgi:membrane protease YdiL (CAAX protease family)
LAHNLSDPSAWLTAEEIPLFVGLFLLGVLLAVAYLVTKSLWCPIGLHAALVAFNSAILETNVLAIDLSPWWLGASDDVRKAPLVWLSFIIASCLLMASRRWLNRLAIETPFVGALTAPLDGQAPPVHLGATSLR